MKSIVALALAATLAPVPAMAEPMLVGVISPRTAMPPKEGAFALVLMPPFGDRDKDVCEQFVVRYGLAGGLAASSAYRIHWLVDKPTPLTRSACAATPPERGVGEPFYDYQQSPDLARQLRLKRDRGPYIVVVQCDPNGTSLVNAGYINLGAAPAAQLPAKFDRFERYLAAPERWGKQRVIDRNPLQEAKDHAGVFVRVLGRGAGLIKEMHACVGS